MYNTNACFGFSDFGADVPDPILFLLFLLFSDACLVDENFFSFFFSGVQVSKRKVLMFSLLLQRSTLTAAVRLSK